MVEDGDSKTLRSGTLAKAASVSPDTIRHYEKLGILPRALRTDGGYRMYPSGALQRVLTVQRAQRIGFTLAELAEVLKARDNGGAPCHRVYELAQEKLKNISADIQSLKRTERALKKVLAEWQLRMQTAAPGEKLHLLHSLTEAVQKSGAPVNQFRRKNKS
jgi:DNA-binding transcriptional MerR regulator